MTVGRTPPPGIVCVLLNYPQKVVRNMDLVLAALVRRINRMKIATIYPNISYTHPISPSKILP